MGRAGFGDFTTLAEPLGVYHVVVGHKEDFNAEGAEDAEDAEKK